MSETSKESSSKSRITPAQWSEAKALWESGEFTLTQISEKVGVTREHLSRRFKKEGIEKGVKKIETTAAAAEAVESELSRLAKILPARIAETKEQHYQWASNIGKLAMQTVIIAQRDGRPLSSTGEDLKALDRLMAIEAKVMEQRYKALGIDREDYVDEESLPTLTIDILTEEEMTDIRSQARAQTLGVDDGLGGTLSDEDENDIVELDDFEDEELEEIEELESSEEAEEEVDANVDSDT